MMVADQSVVTYICTVTPGFGRTASGVQSDISAAFAGLGMSVRSVSSAGGAFVGYAPVTFTFQIQLETGMDYGSENDVEAILNHGVYTATGSMPTSSSLTRVQNPKGQIVNTNQPTPDPGGTAPKGCIAGTPNDTTGSFSVACWWSNMTQKGLASVGFLSIIALLGLGVAIWFGARPRAAS